MVGHVPAIQIVARQPDHQPRRLAQPVEDRGRRHAVTTCSGSSRTVGVLTPHIAGWTHESYVRINEVLVQQLSQALGG